MSSRDAEQRHAPPSSGSSGAKQHSTPAPKNPPAPGRSETLLPVSERASTQLPLVAPEPGDEDEGDCEGRAPTSPGTTREHRLVVATAAPGTTRPLIDEPLLADRGEDMAPATATAPAHVPLQPDAHMLPGPLTIVEGTREATVSGQRAAEASAPLVILRPRVLSRALPAMWRRMRALEPVLPPALPATRRRHHHRRLALMLAAITVIGLALVSPLARAPLEPLFRPQAARLALDPQAGISAPWASSSGAAVDLGIGGGAGPGVLPPPGATGPNGSDTNSATGTPSTTSTPSASPSPSPSAAPRSTPTPKPPPTVLPPPVHPWPPTNPWMAVPGHTAFAVPDPDGFHPSSFGWCTWWAAYSRRDENLTGLGDAMWWAGHAHRRGYHVGTVPAAGATVVFQPGVQGAGNAGHVAHVVAVYPDGWFLVSEMNFYWNGGGWARVDWRYAHVGAGVMFIY